MTTAETTLSSYVCEFIHFGTDSLCIQRVAGGYVKITIFVWGRWASDTTENENSVRIGLRGFSSGRETIICEERALNHSSTLERDQWHFSKFLITVSEEAFIGLAEIVVDFVCEAVFWFQAVGASPLIFAVHKYNGDSFDNGRNRENCVLITKQDLGKKDNSVDPSVSGVLAPCTDKTRTAQRLFSAIFRTIHNDISFDRRYSRQLRHEMSLASNFLKSWVETDGDLTLRDGSIEFNLAVLSPFLFDKNFIKARSRSISFSDRTAYEAFHSLNFGVDWNNKHSWLRDISVESDIRSILNDVVMPALTDKDDLRELSREVLRMNLSLPFASLMQSGQNRPKINDDRASVRSASLCKIFLSGTKATAKDFFDEDDDIDLSRPVYLAISHLCYPRGGGESYLLQTCKVMAVLGFDVVWVTFSDGEALHKFDLETKLIFFTEVRLSGDITEEKVRAVVDRFAPDLVHSHGDVNHIVEKVCKEKRVPAMTGFHFWGGLIELGATGPRHILDHLELHTLVDRISCHKATGSRYLASEFMLEVYNRLGGREEFSIHHPVPEPSSYRADNSLGAYVVQINIAECKGGEIFLACAKALGDEIPFLGVRVQAGSEALDEEIRRELEARNGRYERYGDAREWYKLARIVLVPSLVDETFCRVAYEAAANGIPVLSTRNGFLSQLLGPAGVFLGENADDWIEAVKQLYSDSAKLAEIGNRQRSHILSRHGELMRSFLHDARQLVLDSPKRRIGIFTTWSSQGHGNFGRHHAATIRSLQLGCHIFSFQPYAAIDEALTVQSDPDFWAPPDAADSVYYSFNSRENVPTNELMQFCLANKIGVLLVPEICWAPNWNRLFSLTIPNLRIVALPMIENVRREEIVLHGRLDAVWHVAKTSDTIFTAAGLSNGSYIGHGQAVTITDRQVEAKIENLQRRKTIKLLHVAGHNPYHRKQTPLVLQAFALASAENKNIELTVTCMEYLEEFSFYKDKNLRILTGVLPSKEIEALYYECDASVQVSSHEGLGLGFYESIAQGTPVITIDTSPHNEVIRPGVSGWFVDAAPIVITDNDAAPVKGALVSVPALSQLMQNITQAEVTELIRSSARAHRESFSQKVLRKRFAKAIAELHSKDMI